MHLLPDIGETEQPHPRKQENLLHPRRRCDPPEELSSMTAGTCGADEYRRFVLKMAQLHFYLNDVLLELFRKPLFGDWP